MVNSGQKEGYSEERENGSFKAEGEVLGVDLRGGRAGLFVIALPSRTVSCMCTHILLVRLSLISAKTPSGCVR